MLVRDVLEKFKFWHTELWQQTKSLDLLMYYIRNMEQDKDLSFRIGKIFQNFKKVCLNSKVPLPWFQLVFCWAKFGNTLNLWMKCKSHACGICFILCEMWLWWCSREVIGGRLTVLPRKICTNWWKMHWLQQLLTLSTNC